LGDRFERAAARAKVSRKRNGFRHSYISYRGRNHRLAPGQAVTRGDVASMPTLLEELLDQSQGNAETVGNLGTRALIVVVGNKDPFAQIQ
jgi:hypothetical protein